jgi:DHA1 family tetracycline resistance protein-like MFS transporter
MKNKSLLSIFIVVFVDLLGFSLILPLLPYYAESYGASATIVGLLVASYAAASLFGAPILGRLSDRYGRRPILLVSVIGTFLGFLLLGFADPIGRSIASWFSLPSANSTILGVLFFSRILDGLTGGNITVAQAYISDVTDEKNRAKGLGLIGAAFGLGFIIGPAVGGFLSSWGYNIPAFVAAGLAFVNIFAIAFWLPESLSDSRREQALANKKPGITLSALKQAINRPVVGPLLMVRFFFGIAFATFQSIFALYAQYKLNLSAHTTGYVLAYVGLLSVLVQGVGIGILMKKFTENQLIITGLWLMTLGLVGWAFTPNLWVLLIVMIPIALSGGVLNTVINSAISKKVAPDEIGGMLGISASLESATRVISPSIGGYLLQQLGAWAPGIFSAILMSWAVSFAYRRIIKVNNTTQLSSPKRSTSKPVLFLITIIGLVVILSSSFVLWGLTPSKPMPEALSALISDNQVIIQSEKWITFKPISKLVDTGFIIYPGGHVDYQAYAPAAKEIAIKGFLVVIVPMPLNLAVLDPDAALRVIKAYPEIKHWVVGGHSLGGAMAAHFVFQHPVAVDGLVLWASYSAGNEDLSNSPLKVLSISATLDGLSTPAKIDESRKRLPVATTWVIIKGGDHAQFGWYGGQPGDNPASISRQEQQLLIVDATVKFLAALGK